MKKNAVLLWIVYFLNLIIFPSFFIVEVSSGKYAVDTQIYVVLQVISMVIGIWLYRTKIAQAAKEFVKRPFIRDLAIGYVLRIVLAIIVSNLLGEFTSDNQAQIESLMSRSNLVMMFVLLCVVAPILEELVFREAIIGSFKKSMNVHVLTIISAVLFILLHSLSSDGSGINWMSALLYVPLTIPIVGMYRYYENNIVASITMHFINNFVAFLFLMSM